MVTGNTGSRTLAGREQLDLSLALLSERHVISDRWEWVREREREKLIDNQIDD